MDAACRVAHQRGKVVRRDGIARLDDKVRAHANANPDEVVVHAAQRKQGWDGDLARTRAV